MAVTHRFQTSSFAKIGDREHTPVSFTVFSPPTILSAMTLSDPDLQEYMQIWQEEFGESISPEAARHSAAMLMELFALLVEPLPEASPGTSESSLPDYRT